MDFTRKRIHLMGIGGIGVSSVAQIARQRGAVVSGCDRADSTMLRRLGADGIRCLVGHDPSHLDEVDLLVYSTAVPPREPELLAARARGIDVVHRSELLNRLAEGYQLIGIAGTHGKTTTTWLVAHLLMSANLDPTVMLGGNVAELGGNFRVGRGPFFVTEVDESDGSLLRLAPKLSVITNIDRDHLDHYSGGIGEIMHTFGAYANQTRYGGTVFACSDCPNLAKVATGCKARVVTYGLLGTPDITARNVRLCGRYSTFDVVWKDGGIDGIWLSLPGEHNVQNALAAIAIAWELGISPTRIEDALAHTPTVGRRLERRGEAGGVTVIDDYGHHPTEIRATIAAARGLAKGRLVAVFQPHRYSRTMHLWKEFAEAFDQLDMLVLTSVYAASEPPIEGVGSELIYNEIERRGRVPSLCWVPQLGEVADRLVPLLQPDDTVLTIGAGDVWTVGDAVLERLSRGEVVAR
jgi:UDP-N-acetylmuramate--alanine ligase